MKIARVAWVAVIFSALSIGIGTLPPPTSADGSRTVWDPAFQRSHIQVPIHFKASEVPPFPNEDPALVDPKRWPIDLVIEGKRCSLRITETDNDVVKELHSLSQLTPGRIFGLSYTPPGTTDRIGPTYYWYGDALGERGWRGTRRGAQVWLLYAYYPNGRLLRYSEHVYPFGLKSHTNAAYLTEFFDLEGDLLGFSCSSQKWPLSRKSERFWEGSPVTVDEWGKKKVQTTLAAWKIPNK